MIRTISLSLFATIIWLGLSVDQKPDGSFDLSVSQADAKNGGGKGNGGGNSGGKGNGGSDKSGGAGKGSDKSANKQAGKANKQVAMAEKRNARAELKGLNSLNRNINGLLNSNSPQVAAFRDLFLNEDGTRKEFAEGDELISDADLLDMLDDHFGVEVGDSTFTEVRSMLDQRFDEYKSLPEKVADDEGLGDEELAGEDWGREADTVIDESVPANGTNTRG